PARDRSNVAVGAGRGPSRPAFVIAREAAGREVGRTGHGGGQCRYWPSQSGIFSTAHSDRVLRVPERSVVGFVHRRVENLAIRANGDSAAIHGRPAAGQSETEPGAVPRIVGVLSENGARGFPRGFRRISGVPAHARVSAKAPGTYAGE